MGGMATLQSTDVEYLETQLAHHREIAARSDVPVQVRESAIRSAARVSARIAELGEAGSHVGVVNTDCDYGLDDPETAMATDELRAVMSAPVVYRDCEGSLWVERGEMFLLADRNGVPLNSPAWTRAEVEADFGPLMPVVLRDGTLVTYRMDGKDRLARVQGNPTGWKIRIVFCDTGDGWYGANRWYDVTRDYLTVVGADA